ncbi:recombinase family protein, partial [Clostridium perfringens]
MKKIYCDKSTGKNFNRHEYIKLKDALRVGDTLVVHEFDRSGCNKRLTLKEIQYFKENNVRLVALNLPTTQLNTNDNLMLETINNIIIELYT